MIRFPLAVKGPLGAGEAVETVFEFFFLRFGRGVIDPFAVIDFSTPHGLQVLGDHAEKEGHRAGAVGQGVEDVKVDTGSGTGQFKHIAGSASDVERLKTARVAYGGLVLETAEEPPEKSVSDAETETRETTYNCFERLIETRGNHILVKAY